MLGATLCCLLIFYASNTQDEQMVLQFKGDSYRSRAIAQSRNSGGGVVAKTAANFMEGIMAIDESVTKEANSLSLSFLREIESSKTLQAKADAEWATIQAHLKEFKKDESWDDAYTGWVTQQFLNRGVTDTVRGDLFKNIQEGNLEIIVPSEQKAEKAVELVSPEESYVTLMAELAEKESSGDHTANVLIEKGSQKGTYAMGLYGFTEKRLKDWADVHSVDYESEKTKKSFNAKFLNSPELQNKVMLWHLKDLDKRINKIGFNKLSENKAKLKDGTPITRNGMIAAAHLGGFGGMVSFVKSKGNNNPDDQFGTTLATYAKKFQGGGAIDSENKKEETLLSGLQTYFNSGNRGKKKAIKLAMNAYNLSEDEAEQYLVGSISKHGTKINASNVRLKANVEFPKTFDGVLAAQAELLAKFPDFKPSDEAHPAFKRYNALDDLKKIMITSEDDRYRREMLNNPKNLEALDFDTFRQIVVKQTGDIARKDFGDDEEAYLKAVEDAMDAKGFDLAFDIYLQRRKYATSLSKMPDVGNVDTKTDYEGYELKVLQAYGVTDKGDLDETVQKTLETIESSLSTTDPNLPKTFDHEALLHFREENPLATSKETLAFMTKIAMAKSVAENKNKMPSTKMEALAVLDNTEASADQLKAAKRILNQLSTNDMKPVGGKTNYTIDGVTYTNYRYDLYLKYNHVTQENELVDSYGNKVDNETQMARKEEIENVTAIHNALSIDTRKHNDMVNVSKNFGRLMKRLTGIVEEHPKVITAGGTVASTVSSATLDISSIFSTVNDLFGGEDTTINRSEVENRLREINFLESGQSLRDLLNQKITDLAGARKQFVAGAVLAIFTTGQVYGQTGQSMSNKDYDRFSKFLLGFKDSKNFFESVGTFMQRQNASINDSANAINGSSLFEAHANQYGGARPKPTAKNLTALKNSDEEFKELSIYFDRLATSSITNENTVVNPEVTQPDSSSGDPLLNIETDNGVDPALIRIDFDNLPDGVSAQEAYDSLEVGEKFIATDGKVGTKQ
jgi:hypothetical protein